jgi:predicted  nucleic acid-binding Zn-ribbon protein
MTDYRMTCRHCGQRFLEMAKLLFHRCPGQGNAQNRARSHAKQPTKVKAANPTERRTWASSAHRWACDPEAVSATEEG